MNENQLDTKLLDVLREHGPLQTGQIGEYLNIKWFAAYVLVSRALRAGRLCQRPGLRFSLSGGGE